MAVCCADDNSDDNYSETGGVVNSMWCQHAGVRFQLTRKNMKTMRIRIKARSGDVLVSAPHRVATEQVLAFVAAKSDWIRGHVEQIKQQPDQGETLDWHKLEEQRAALQRYAEQRLPYWAERIGVEPLEVRIKKMHSRWGSCNIRSKRIWLSLMLADKPFELVDYVLVHELVHLHEANHSARFYRLMDRFLPNWQRFDKELNPNRRRRL